MHQAAYSTGCIILVTLASLTVSLYGTTAAYLAAAAVAVIGVPHGGLDHWTGKRLLEPRWGRSWAIVFFGVYLGIATVVVGGWLILPLPTALAFFIVAAWHFGSEDHDSAKSVRPLDHLVAIATGGLVIWIPALCRPSEMSQILATIIPASLDSNVGEIMTLTRVLGTAAITVVLVTIIGSILGRRDWSASIRHLSSAILFAFAPILVSFVVYFCGWHSLRGLSRLRREHGLAWRELFVRVAPLSLAAVALIGGSAWFWRAGFDLSESVVRGLFVGLSAIAVPHLLLHAMPVVASEGNRWDSESRSLLPAFGSDSPCGGQDFGSSRPKLLGRNSG